MKAADARGTTSKHAGSRKYSSKKHTPTKTETATVRIGGVKVTVKATMPVHAKARKLASGSLSCCPAEALAASLRLAGGAVHGDDVEELYWRTAADEDAGASILATLEAAAEHGLAGVRPVSLGGLAGVGACRRLVLKPPLRRYFATSANVRRSGERVFPSGNLRRPPASLGLILGLELPGPHAVFATGDTWWSWGQPWHRSAFPHAVVEEAWAVSWS